MRRPYRKSRFFVYLLICLLTVFSFSVASAFAQDVIIDNLDPGQQPPPAGWSESSGSFEYAGSSYWARGGLTYDFIFNCPSSGRWEALEHHSIWPSRSDNVLVTIEHDGGSTPTYVDQTTGDQDTWILLGEFDFSAGTPYKVTITASEGSTSTSADAIMFRPVVAGAPSIMTQPSDQSVVEGATATFSVTAEGTGELSYQWRENGVDIPTATSASYTTPATTIIAHNGNEYDCVVTNDVGEATSNKATLTVLAEGVPVIIDNLDPGQQPPPAGWSESSGSFEYAGSSYWARGGLTYDFIFNCPSSGRWEALEHHSIWPSRSDNVLVTIEHDGGSTPTYVDQTTGDQDTWILLGEFDFSAGTPYKVTITASEGSTSTSADAIMFRPVVSGAPEITTDPASQTVTAGDTATFTVVATGTSLNYQWRKNGGNITGANSAVYTTPATIFPDDNGSTYDCVVSNTAGTVTSAAATLTVEELVVAPEITTDPASQTVTAGDTATFTVVATGTSLNYQWRKNGGNITGANSAVYTTPATIFPDDNGSTYDCVVSNTAGTVTSAAATLTVEELVVAPEITTDPASQTVTAGDTATFTVVATGTSLNYQWRKNGGNITGANSAVYTTPATIFPDDNGSTYDCVVSNTAGTVTSAAATLTVEELVVAPEITTDPASQTVTAGDTATFTVVATGTSLNYQWRKNGGNITGANSAVYTTPATIFPDDNGSTYDCVVSNTAGTVTSAAATLTVEELVVAPEITTDPASQTVTAGDTATFTVVATGTSLNYQWRKNGGNITGANSAVYTTPATIFPDDNGSTYDCVVSNTAGTVTSAAATLTVEELVVAPEITTDPASQTVTAGDTATFTVVATGTSLNYQWRKNGGNITGANSAVYTTPATIFPDDNGSTYDCVVSNTAGTVTSAAATLTVEELVVAPEITTDPASQTVTAGDTATFTVVATGTSLNYQWRKNGGNITGANSAVYTTPATIFPDDNGSTYDCVVSNTAGTVTSAAATLTVEELVVAPEITTDPASQTVTAGDTATFTVVATGTSLNYQWRKNGGNITGANSAVYTTPATIFPDDNGSTYDCVVSNTAGTVTSAAATLTVEELVVAPEITTDPASQTVTAGDTATFTVVATGTSLNYQWRKNGGNITGANSAVYTTPATIFPDDNGSTYDCVVSNTAGSVTSAAATLTVTEGDTAEHIYVAPIFARNFFGFKLVLQDLGATQEDAKTWRYTNPITSQEYVVHDLFDDLDGVDVEGVINAITTEDSNIIFAGHANYGIGGGDCSLAECQAGRCSGIYFVDDPRILKFSTPFFDVSISGIRGHFGYDWDPIFENGTSAFMPYVHNDPTGMDPPYDHYIGYYMPGDSTFYMIDSPTSLPIRRFLNFDGPAWDYRDGDGPEASNPDHWPYFATATPLCMEIGDWTTANDISGYYSSNYYILPDGDGSNEVRWISKAPTEGNYRVFAWWPSDNNNTAGAIYKIGTAEIPVDQTSDGGQFNELGDFYFRESEQIDVVLTDSASPGNVVADAVKVIHTDDLANDIIQANFRANYRSRELGQSVRFYNQSTNIVTDYLWEFGDGSTSTSSSPYHTYSATGTYDVTLTVWGPAGTSTLESVNYISVIEPDSPDPVLAEFSNSSPTGNTETMGAEVDFRSRSMGDNLSYAWDLDGDGEFDDSSEERPTYTYTSPGLYNVSLRVTDGSNSDTKTKENYVRVVYLSDVIDNMTSQYYHYNSRSVLYRKDLEVAKEDMKYKRLLYESCQTGRYYLGTFTHGIVHYTTESAAGLCAPAFMQGILEGKTDNELWQICQSFELKYDYYNFGLKPSEQNNGWDR